MSPPRPTASASLGRLQGAAAVLLREGFEDIADALSIWGEAPQTITFEIAWNVGVGVRGRARVETRNARLQDLARLHFAHLRGRPLAAAVDHACLYYETTLWPEDKRLGRRPDGISGAVFDVLVWGSVPSANRLRQILNISIDLAG